MPPQTPSAHSSGQADDRPSHAPGDGRTWPAARRTARWLALLVPWMLALPAGSAWAAGGPAQARACPAVLQSTQPRLQDEKPIDLCAYAGQVVLVVNTASFCGYTPQYKALEALHDRLRSQGLVVLGFPSNDFGQQEPGSNAEIASFCENTFGVKFPMFAKSHVSAGAGRDPVNPLFTQLAQRTGSAPRWNFHKYLISRDGRTVLSHGSSVSPEDPKFKMDLEKLLKAN